jgi:hypothetical protein
MVERLTWNILIYLGQDPPPPLVWSDVVPKMVIDGGTVVKLSILDHRF